MGSRAFSKLQWGLESVNGTAVAADTMLLAAPMPILPDRQAQFPMDMAGVKARSAQGPQLYEYLVRNTLSWDNDHPPYFQVLPMLFSCGIKGNVTPVEQNPSEGDYLWTFTPSLTATNDPDSITLEAGDDVQAYECEYTMFDRYRIAGEIAQDGVGSPVNIDADFFARQWTTTTFTGALSLPSTELMAAKVTSFYLDTTWAGVGGTQKTGLLRSYDIEILTGVKWIFAGDANKYFNNHAEEYLDVRGTFVFEGNSDADAIFDAFQAASLQVLRLQVTGAQIGVGDNHSMILDIGGAWVDVTPMGQEDRGNNLHTATFQGYYDQTGAKLLQLTVTTDVSAI